MIANTVTQQIKDSFDAISLILVFVTVFFGVKYPAIWADIRSTTPPSAQPIARKQHRKHLRTRLLTDCVPLLVVTGVAWILFLPLFIHVAAAEPFHPWNRDMTENAFLFIAAMTGLFFLWSGGFVVALLVKITRAR